MSAATRMIAACLLLLSLAPAAHAQDEVLTLETSFDGDVTPAVADQLRQTLHQGLSESSPRPVLTEAESRSRLGADADRLMRCGSDQACLMDAGHASGCGVAVVAAVSVTGEIYSYAIDVYDLSTGQGLHYDDSDCPLCTVDEAQTELLRLARDSGTAIPAPAPAAVAEATPPPSTPEATPETPVEATPQTPAESTAPTPPAHETVMLYVRAQPESAQIRIDAQDLGAGVGELEVGPGTHRIHVEAPGYQPVDQTIEVAAGDADKLVQVTLEPMAGAAMARQGGAMDDIDTTVVGSVLAGTGLASLVTGIVLLVIDGDTTCSEGPISACPNVYDTRAGGTLLTVLGTAGLTAGTILLLWDTLAGEPTPLPSTTPTAGVDVSVRPDGAFVLWGSHF